MTMNTKKEVFREYLNEYLKADRPGKSKILDNLIGVTKMHRKAIIRSLKREQMRYSQTSRRGAGRPVIYGKDVTAAIREVWEIAGEICAERLHPIILEYVCILQRDKMWHHGDNTTEKLLNVSLGTLKNRIDGFVRIKDGGGRSTTKPSNLKEIIPVRRGPWDNPDPGFGEIDTVVHCGSSLCGDMAYTVNYTDIATGWGEWGAQINKGQIRTKENIAKIKERLPFPLLGLDPDTGSEFINWHLKGWCDDNKIELTRSRPNHKNDNAHVEQKNYTNVRKLLGYARIDNQRAVDVMNELYSGPWRLYVNFFQPSMKCVLKKRIGSRYVRKYDTPKTPYQRVMEHKKIDQSVKDELARVKENLNPLILRREIDRLAEKVFKIQKQTAMATPKK